MKKRKLIYPFDLGIIMALMIYTLLDTFVIPRTYAAEAATAVEEGVVANSSEIEDGKDAADEAGTSDTAGNSGVANAAGDSGITNTGGNSEVSDSTADTAAANTAQTDNSQASASQTNASQSTTAQSSSDPIVTDTSYTDENVSIQIDTYRWEDTTIYVADVQVSSPEYLYTALAQSTYGKNVTAETSEIADDANAILAINGDYYGARNKGYVIRNGVLYRSTSSGSSQEDLVIYADGSFEIISEGSTSAESLLADGAVQVLSFGPGLIIDGEIAVDSSDEVGKAMASNPRTAICEIEPLHYLLVVSDGRTDESEGLSLYELASFLETLGVENAYNLDGGGSSTMVFNGTVINNPTTSGRSIKERSVSDAFCIGSSQA